MNKSQIEQIKNNTFRETYYVQVRVIKVNKFLSLPLQSLVRDGKRIFTNNLENEILFMDCIALEDFINF